MTWALPGRDGRYKKSTHHCTLGYCIAYYGLYVLDWRDAHWIRRCTVEFVQLWDFHMLTDWPPCSCNPWCSLWLAFYARNNADDSADCIDVFGRLTILSAAAGYIAKRGMIRSVHSKSAQYGISCMYEFYYSSSQLVDRRGFFFLKRKKKRFMNGSDRKTVIL